MCTRALWTEAGEAVLAGRNMDYAHDLETNLWAFPRGMNRLPTPSNETEAVASLLSVMRNVSQPARIADLGKPDASQTLWRTIADLTRGIYVFEATDRPNILWTTFEDLDLSAGAPAQKLDLLHHQGLEDGLMGNISSEFSPTAPMEFLGAS